MAEGKVQKSCSECGTRGTRFIRPYWNRRRGLCAACCFDQNKKFDRDGWPQEGRMDGPVPPDGRVLIPGASPKSPAVPQPVGQSTSPR